MVDRAISLLPHHLEDFVEGIWTKRMGVDADIHAQGMWIIHEGAMGMAIEVHDAVMRTVPNSHGIEIQEETVSFAFDFHGGSMRMDPSK